MGSSSCACSAAFMGLGSVMGRPLFLVILVFLCVLLEYLDFRAQLGIGVRESREIGGARLGVQLGEHRVVAIHFLELEHCAVLVGDIAEHDRLGGAGLCAGRD